MKKRVSKIVDDEMMDKIKLAYQTWVYTQTTSPMPLSKQTSAWKDSNPWLNYLNKKDCTLTALCDDLESRAKVKRTIVINWYFAKTIPSIHLMPTILELLQVDQDTYLNWFNMARRMKRKQPKKSEAK